MESGGYPEVLKHNPHVKACLLLGALDDIERAHLELQQGRKAGAWFHAHLHRRPEDGQ